MNNQEVLENEIAIEQASFLYKKTLGRNRILITLENRLLSINMKEVQYFYLLEKVVFVVTTNNFHYPTDYNSLDKVYATLDETEYFRINRQFIVSMHSIKEIRFTTKGRIKVEVMPPTTQETQVSIDRTSDFKKWLDN